MTVDGIKALLTESSGFVSGEYISGKLGVSRAAVWKGIKRLRGEGYEIVSVTNKGYKLVACPDVLDGDEVARFSGKNVNVICLQVVDSTNNELKKRALDGAPEGTIILADCQSAGRGRYGRSFESPRGKGLYMSILLKPESLTDISGLTCLCAVAVARAVNSLCGIDARIKWTNDIIADGRKLCGILTELSSEGESGELRHAVVGIGINAAQSLEDFPEELHNIACSLYMLTGQRYARNELSGRVIGEFFRLYEAVKAGDLSFMDEYREICFTVGKDVEFVLDGKTVSAKAVGIGDDGALILEFPDGTSHVLRFGEATVKTKK